MIEILVAVGMAAAGMAGLWLIACWERRNEARHAAWERGQR